MHMVTERDTYKCVLGNNTKVTLTYAGIAMHKATTAHGEAGVDEVIAPVKMLPNVSVRLVEHF